MDSQFRVDVVSQVPKPNRTIYTALHTDYCERNAFDEVTKQNHNERKYGEIIVRRLLPFGHWGPLEHVQICFHISNFPHDVMVQHRTHRLASFDVCSQRYTGQRVIDVADGVKDVEDVFYFPQPGQYIDREGKRFNYTDAMRRDDIDSTIASVHRYKNRTEKGMPYEMARRQLPQNIRQNYVFSSNLRSILHLFDMRSKADAQQEIQQLCTLMEPHIAAWVPEIWGWYKEKRYGKNKLAP